MRDVGFLLSLVVDQSQLSLDELRIHFVLGLKVDLMVGGFHHLVRVLLNWPIAETLDFALFLGAAQHDDLGDGVHVDHFPKVADRVLHGGLGSNVGAVGQSSLISDIYYLDVICVDVVLRVLGVTADLHQVVLVWVRTGVHGRIV